MQLDTDFLIIGSGIAGLSYALRVAEHGRVIVVTKKGRAESNTNYAQGGIASVTAKTLCVPVRVSVTKTSSAW